MPRPLIAVKRSGSIFTTKNLFAIIEKPEIIAVRRTRSVPRISFLDRASFLMKFLV